MNFERTKDVIDHMSDLHATLGKYYKDLCNTAEKQKVKMLLDYLARHQIQLANSLSNYEKDAEGKLLNTWFQYTPEQDVLKSLEGIELAADMSLDEVISFAIKMDDTLIDVYEEMANHAGSDGVKQLFDNLIDMEQHEKLRSVRNAALLYDL